jgi:nitronate monooxygenase
VELCVTYRAPIVICGGLPHAPSARAVHSYGGTVLHQVDSEEGARAALAAGADGLVLLPAPRANFPLLRAVRRWFRGPLVLAGLPFLRGAAVLAAQAAGANLVQARVTLADAARYRADWPGRAPGS